MCRWSCIPWVFRGSVFKRVFGIGFFFSPRVTSAVSFVCLFMFLSSSLFHLQGYQIRLNDQPVSGMSSYFESQQSSTFREL